MAVRKTEQKLEFNYGEIDGYFDAIGFGFSLGQMIIDEARASLREYAHSYREDPFLVGTAGVVNAIEGRRAGLLWGHNYKPNAEAETYCAEMDLSSTKSRRAFTHTEIIVVAGPEDVEAIAGVNEHGIATHTLPPCHRCRGGGHIDDASLVLTVGDTTNHMQAWTGLGVKQFFDHLPKSVTQRKAKKPLVFPPQPDLIDFTSDPYMFWARAHGRYQQNRPDHQQVDVGDENALREFRLARAQVAVASIVEAADDLNVY